MTLIQRETFQGVGTLDASMPGNLGAVSFGSFYKRPVGPRLSADTTAASRGWSADLASQNPIWHSFTNGAAFPAGDYGNPNTVFAFDWWFYAEQPITNGSNGGEIIDVIGDTSGRYLMRIDTAASNGLTLAYTTYADAIGTVVSVPYTLTRRQWTNLRVVWQKLPGGYYDYEFAVYAREAGASTWTQIYHMTDGRLFASVSRVSVGCLQGAPNARYGMPSLYRLDTWADATALVADVIDPPTGPFEWYCNPATGNDSNDGTSAASPWATVTKINSESSSLGMFGRSSGNGDRLTIDTAGSNLLLGTSSLTIATQGLNVSQLGGGSGGTGELQAWATIPASGWSLVNGTTNTYQVALTETNLSCVLWEDDKWMNHPTGANLDAVLPALKSTPNSFWTNGTMMYVHPSGDTDPVTDGKTYTRSFHRGSPFGSPAISIAAPDVRINGLRVRKTCLADESTNDPVAAYCIQTVPGAGGNMVLDNRVCSYGGKHIYGFTDADLTRQYTVNNCRAEQGSPYVAAGGQTAWVDYSVASGTGTATTVYNDCITNKNSGLIGSTEGVLAAAQPVWLSHNSGSTNYQFASVSFNDCQLAGAVDTYGATAQVNFVGGSCVSAGLNNSNGFFSRVLFTGGLPTGPATYGNIRVSNCILVLSGGNPNLEVQVQGSLDVQNCTFDLRGLASNNPYVALFSRVGVLKMIWRNNLMLGSPTGAVGVLRNANTTDALAFDHNIYQDTPSPWINYDDGRTTVNRSIAQCQVLGQEAGSMAVTDARVDSVLSPLADSPLIDAGVDTHFGTDYGGAAFSVRNDPGAWEYPLPALRGQPHQAEVVEGTALNLTVQAIGNGPLTYQWFTGGISIPGATAATLHIENLLPGDSGQYVVTVANNVGSVSTDAVTVVVHPLGLEQWRTARFTAEQLLLPYISSWGAKSPDNSGLTNLEEYMFGVLPQGVAGSIDGLVPVGRLSTYPPDGSSHLAIRYRRLINVVDVRCLVEVSDDLLTWDDSQAQVERLGSPSVNSDKRTETVTDMLKLPSSSIAGTRKFLRVRVDALNPAEGAGSSGSRDWRIARRPMADPCSR